MNSIWKQKLFVASVLCLVCCSLVANARHEEKRVATSLPGTHELHAAFRPVLEEVRHSIVEIRALGETWALGTIVTTDGWVVTKASTLPDTLQCRLVDGRSVPATLLKKDDRYDIAFLKIDARDLRPVPLHGGKDFRAGQWLISASPRANPIGVGIVSVPPRRIPADRGFLGIELDLSTRRALVTAVIPGTPAAAYEIRKDDVIIGFQGNAVRTRTALQRMISAIPPGTEISLEVERGEERLNLEVPLGERPSPDPPGFKEVVSLRRSGFQSAIQHDTPLRPDQCGGPIVDIQGKVVAINIARAGRTASLAIPVSVILPMLTDI